MEKLNDMPYIPDLKGMGFTAPTDNVLEHATAYGSQSTMHVPNQIKS